MVTYPKVHTQPMTASQGSALLPTLTLAPLNANVYTVHTPSGEHVGNLKRVGAVWKLKAIGYEAGGGVLPGGGPLTDYHNTVLQVPDAADLNAALAASA
jgi:hypothetical protein